MFNCLVNCLATMLTLGEMIVIGVLTGPVFLVAACGMTLALWSLLFVGYVLGDVGRRTRVG